MRRSIACATVVVGCFALSGSLFPARADGVAVGYRQLSAVDVPDGVVSNVDSVVLGNQSTLYKTGAGTLAVNGGALKSVTDERLTVLEGVVSVTTSADADFTTPPAVCDIAAFWVNASSVATTNGVVEEGETPPVYVSKWLDVRETNPESPTRYYALPKWCTSDNYPATLYGIDPVPATFDGRDGVYFGGNFDAVRRYVELGGPVEGRIKFIVGYSGWAKDQIASEIERHDWAVLNDCGRGLLMDDGDDDQWRKAVSRFGDRYRMWLNLPSDPTNN